MVTYNTNDRTSSRISRSILYHINLAGNSVTAPLIVQIISSPLITDLVPWKEFPELTVLNSSLYFFIAEVFLFRVIVGTTVQQYQLTWNFLCNIMYTWMGFII